MTKNTALIPPIISDWGSQLLKENSAPEIRENFAQRLEDVRDYCIECLATFEKKKKTEQVIKKPRKAS